MALVVVTSPVLAAGTDPTLSISAARIDRASSGALALTVHGTYSYDDLVQHPFPAGLIVTQGEVFVHYRLDGTVREGSAAFVGDGLTPDEVALLRGLGAQAPEPAALVRLRPHRITVVLPGNLQSGTVTVLLYAQVEGETFLSNAVNATIPASGSP